MKRLGKWSTWFLIAMFVLISAGRALAAGNWGAVGGEGGISGDNTFFRMVLDSTGQPYIAFNDPSQSDKTTVMKYNGASWELVGGAGFVSAQYRAFALDGNNVPYIAFTAPDNEYKAHVMKFDGSIWVDVGGALSSNYTYGHSIDFDDNNVPYVIYQENDTSSSMVKAAVKKFNGTAWESVGTDYISDGNASYVNIKFDNNNTPYVAYEDSEHSYKAVVKKLVSGSWELVGTEGFSTGDAEYLTLAIDHNGVPYVAYQDYRNSPSETYYATVKKFNDTDWVTVGVEQFSPNGVEFISLAFDSANMPYVGFHDYNDIHDYYQGMVWKFNGTSWVKFGPSLTPAETNRNAYEVNIAIDSADTIYAGYFDDLYGKLVVKKFIPSIERAKNGGFNIYATPTAKIPKNWKAMNFAATDGKFTKAKKEGSASISIVGQSGVTKTLTQTLALSGTAGQQHVFSFWVKGSSVPSQGVCKGTITLYNNKTVVTSKSLSCPGKTYAFKKKTITFNSTGAYNKVVIKFTYAKASGTVWFDLVSLQK